MPRLLSAVLLALVVVCLYVQALGFAFLRDDIELLAEGSKLPAYSLMAALRDNTWHTDQGAVYYRPAIFWSHRMDLKLWGHQPAGHHLTNLVAFMLFVLTLHELLLRRGAAPEAAFLASLVVACHPVNVDVVAWISGRADLLAALFGAAAFVVQSHAGAALLLLHACLSKETGVCFVLAAALCPGDRRRLLIVVLLPALVYAGLRLSSHPRPKSGAGARPDSVAEVALVNAVNARLWGRYLAMTLTGADYGGMAHDELMTRLRVQAQAAGPDPLPVLFRQQLDRELVLSLIALLAFLPWFMRSARAHPAAAALAALAILVATNFTSTRVQILFAPRYLLPVLAALAVILAPALTTRPRQAVALALAVAFAACTLERLPGYESPRAFYMRAIAQNPDSPQAYERLGTLLYIEEDYAAAVRLLEPNAVRLWHPRLFCLELEARVLAGDAGTARALAARYPSLVTEPATRELLKKRTAPPASGGRGP